MLGFGAAGVGLFHCGDRRCEVAEVDRIGKRAGLEFLGGEHGKGGELHGWLGLVDGGCLGLVGDGPGALDHLAGGGVAEADEELADLAGAIGEWLDLIEGGAGFIGGELCGIDGVVAEILGLEAVFLEADELVVADPLRVEFHLDLDVFGGGAEGSGELLGEALAGVFADEVIAAVAVAGEFGEEAVVDVVGADAGDVEGEILLAEGFHPPGKAFGIGVAEVRGAIGEEDDAVLRAIGLVAEGEVFGEVDRLFQVGAAFAGGLVDDVRQLCRLIPGKGIREQVCGSRKADDGDAVVGLHEGGELGERLVHRRPAVAAGHGAGLVDEQGEDERLGRGAAGGGGADGHADEVATGDDRMGDLADGRCYGFSRRWSRVFVGNCVVELLRLDRFRIGPLALRNGRAGDLERGVGDVQGEGGEGLLLGGNFVGEIGEVDGLLF